MDLSDWIFIGVLTLVSGTLIVLMSLDMRRFNRRMDARTKEFHNRLHTETAEWRKRVEARELEYHKARMEALKNIGPKKQPWEE